MLVRADPQVRATYVSVNYTKDDVLEYLKLHRPLQIEEETSV